jgi:predicted RNase H-related nuclease YkuK (DUF458 family)
LDIKLDSSEFYDYELSKIDMDYNDDEYYESHRLVSSARGWASSYGYKVNIKPHKQIATKAADYHCK